MSIWRPLPLSVFLFLVADAGLAGESMTLGRLRGLEMVGMGAGRGLVEKDISLLNGGLGIAMADGVTGGRDCMMRDVMSSMSI